MKLPLSFAILFALPFSALAAEARSVNACFYEFLNDGVYNSLACRQERARASADYAARLENYRQSHATFAERIEVRIKNFLRAHGLSEKDLGPRQQYPRLVRVQIKDYACEFSDQDISCVMNGAGYKQSAQR